MTGAWQQRDKTFVMKFSIGDKVLLKQTGEEGTVTGYLNPGMYEVEVAGVVFPVYEDAMEHPYLKWFTEQKKKKRTSGSQEILPPQQGSFHQGRHAQGVFLSFLPVYSIRDMEDTVDELKVYLLNELPYPVRFRYEVRVEEQQIFFHEGSLAAFSHIYLHNIPYADMNDRPRFHWLVADADSSKGLKEKDGILRIRPAQLFQRISEIQQNNEPTFSFLLVDTFITAAAELSAPVKSSRIISVPPVRPNASPFQELPRYELDLHIEQIEPDYRKKKLTNADMLQIQTDYLRYYLRLAIAHHFSRMIIIHGLGRGTLRDAVHQVLRETPEVSRFANEWMGQYGFGATEVHFSY